MRHSADQLVQRLRAAAEPTRLRLLVVLSRGEFSVGELTEILGQSQPRVSRHLRLLGDCGLLERFREQHWIYYRVPVEGDGAEFVADLLAKLADDDPVTTGDAVRVAGVLEARRGSRQPEATPSSENADDALAEAISIDLGDAVLGSLLLFGRAPGRLLSRLGQRARRIVGVHPSRDELQRARAQLHALGLSHCVLQQGEASALSQPANTFDVVILDRVVASSAAPARVMREAARVLVEGGRLIVVEDFDALAEHGSTRNPLAQMRDWVSNCGLVCRRLRPVDAGPTHLLVAVAGVETVRAVA
jgi:DNA-binding transcriptional ArsR family regulator